MARHYGIPYMGSKQKLVDKLIPFVLSRHPGATHFYDLFGGGGSVSLYMVRKYPDIEVHYNELSKAITALMQHLRDGGAIPFDFVKRADFERLYTGDDWYAGLLQTCWTFGNNQKSYLYGLDIQDFKEELSKMVLTGRADLAFIEQFNDRHMREKFGKEVSTSLFINPKRYHTTYQRRIAIARQMPQLGALQHLARLERLVQIQNMPGIGDLNITPGLSYDAVPIEGKAILYCDPPYENAAEYREGGFDSRAFYDWAMASKHPVYISSYKVSDPRLKLVKAINTRSLLAAAYTDKASYNYEKLYWNGVE